MTEPMLHVDTEDVWRSRMQVAGSPRNSRRTLRPQDRWNTPRGLFQLLDQEFGFDLDVAADAENHLTETYFDEATNGLLQSWAPNVCWMNPPYSLIDPWTKKAVQEASRGAVVVGLLPVRTDLAWFHRDVIGVEAEVRFIRGRVRFSDSAQNAPFPSMIVVWRSADPQGADE